MTPATVQHVFAAAGVPIVRYARRPELCGAGRCVGFDYAGGGIRAYLAPRTGPDFLVVLFRTPAEARAVADVVHAPARGNALLFLGPTHRAGRLRRVFAKIAP
jgi:hypothetical protein